MKKGSLIVVGTGIKFGGHITIEAQAQIVQAEQVFYVAGNRLMGEWIASMNASAVSLSTLYAPDKPRLETYAGMVDVIMTAVRSGKRVCAVFYGHPGVFVVPSHEAICQAREEGFPAVMLPGVSAADCLYADLGIDPAVHGCQMFEATDFLIRGRPFDPTSTLIVWQIEVIGHLKQLVDTELHRHGLAILAERLLEAYPAAHPVTIYQAAQFPVQEPYIHTIPLESLPTAPIPAVATLIVRPYGERPINETILAQLS